jgi:hypothetical protein
MELWMPWIKLAVILLAAFALLWNFFRLKTVQGKKQVIIKSVSVIISVSLFLLVAWSAFMQGGERNSGLFGSPDGNHVARIMITSGTIADSRYSSVIVRKSGSPTWRRAYYGFGYFQEGGPAMPYIHWADNTHLIIDYQVGDEPSTCVNKVENIFVECRAHNW